MATLSDQMTEIYVFVDDFLKSQPALAEWRASNNANPTFSDAEVITIALMQGCFGVATLKKTYLLTVANFRSAFPHVCSYKQWLARLHQLTGLAGHLIEAARLEDRYPAALYLLDSKPIPVCMPIRHGRVRLLREDGAYWGKTSKGWFFGFKLHQLINVDGHICGVLLTPANTSDRDVAAALGQFADGGIILGDRAYFGGDTAELLEQEADLLLITPKDAGSRRALISSLREGIETVFSKLWGGFIDRIFSRSWNGLWNTIKLKLVAYNLVHAGILSV